MTIREASAHVAYWREWPPVHESAVRIAVGLGAWEPPRASGSFAESSFAEVQALAALAR